MIKRVLTHLYSLPYWALGCNDEDALYMIMYGGPPRG